MITCAGVAVVGAVVAGGAVVDVPGSNVVVGSAVVLVPMLRRVVDVEDDSVEVEEWLPNVTIAVIATAASATIATRTMIVLPVKRD